MRNMPAEPDGRSSLCPLVSHVALRPQVSAGTLDGLVPSNHNYVCFDCRIAVRRSKTATALPLCAQCGRECKDLGYKIPLPPKADVDAWQDLYVGLRETKRRSVERQAVKRVALVHDLQRQLARLEGLPVNPGRANTISELRKQLAHAQRLG